MSRGQAIGKDAVFITCQQYQKGYRKLREELKMVLKFDGMDLKRLLI
jgi:hypothetical protein